MNLFIDTNIFLSFYHLSSDDLEELRKLAVLLDQERVTLFLPEQVIDEFYRNREGKIADALSKFKSESLNNQFPQICKQYEEYEKMRTAIKEFNEAKSRLLEKVTSDILNETLKADDVIDDLFSKSYRIEITEDIYIDATRRFNLGNPPGKKGSYGDSVNWEALLSAVPSGEDLYFISDDQDFASPIQKDYFLPFLEKEWLDIKEGNIYFFKRMSAYFVDQFPDINLASELEKDFLIRELASSKSFAETRRILKKLVKHGDFTETQINDFVLAAISNNQVYWIIKDADISKYITKIVSSAADLVEKDNLRELGELMTDQGSSETESFSADLEADELHPF